ncbi:CAP domain-containing protein [Tabrizicola sp.]|uniref:CAP domain-containing protein n=1 Tax=Tabrizicola sp. TaxID=2005166 RepID=UPI00262C93FC|nr:CAP domain-containing protein [Tabrizicola sp.]MDM7930899.1 CAP domain-containing protein [Tabrizicola sp.]
MTYRLFNLAIPLCVAIGLATPGLACTIPAGAGAMQQELLSHLNAERRANGLSPLRLSAKLDKAAQGHACDNAARKSISHVSSDGGTLKNRLRRAGYAFRAAAENTGRGFASGARAVQWWMNSPKHRDNILLRKAREVGIGIAVSPAPDAKLHWILVVGASK